MSRLIEVAGVSKAFRIPSVRRDTVRDRLLNIFERRRMETLQVLDGVDFTVDAGERLGIMGRNGCGKSTLLKILVGIYRADGGRVTVRAPVTPILELGVGWNPQLDAIDNIYLVGAVMGLGPAEIRASLDDMLSFAELERFANLELQHYSSGMAARLAYAVAFHAVRDILVLDEIFAVGDAGFKARCAERYDKLVADGRTVVMVSHNPAVVARFCDRALLLDGGRTVLDGAASEVAAAYQSRLAPGVTGGADL